MEMLRKLLFTAFQEMWTDAGDLFPVEYENQPFVEPATGPYGRLTLIPGENVPASVGPNHTRQPGLLILQIFVRVGDGMAQATAAADAMTAGLEYITLSDDSSGVRTFVECETVTFRPVAGTTGYKQFNAALKFRCDKLKT